LGPVIPGPQDIDGEDRHPENALRENRRLFRQKKMTDFPPIAAIDAATS
jgi:hypothetical protein